ncbi:MAG: hypothetical protein JWM98_268 [Thermoleophilia bacterium]|nr:hypothetical protein [Thermoleophilia bacterium]
MSIHQHIAARAARSHGILTRAELHELGLSDRQIRRLSTVGLAHEIHPGVFAIGHVALSRHAVLLAAAKGGGPTAFVSGRAGAELWDATRHRARRILVVTPARHRPVASIDLLESTTLAPEDVTTRYGVPTASVPRMLVDAARTTTVEQLCNFLHEIDFQHPGAYLPADIERCIDRNPKRAGIGRVKRMLTLHLAGSAGTMSSLEAVAVGVLTAAGLGDFEIGVRVATAGGPLRLDLLYRGAMVCVELDGNGHGRKRTGFDDARRDALLRPRGFITVRVEEHEILYDHATFIGKVASALAFRSAAVPPRTSSAQM